MSPIDSIRPLSLRRQLLVPLAWVWLLGLGATVAGASWLASASANAAFDRGLQDETAALAAKVVWTDRGPLLDISRQAMELLNWDRETPSRFVVLDEAGHVLAGDATVPRPDLRHQSFAQPQLFDVLLQGQWLRGAQFSLRSPMLDRSVTVIKVEASHKRSSLMRDVLLAMAVPTLAIALLTVLLLNWGIRRGLAPLRAVAREVERRALSDLRPLPVEGVPAEAAPLIERINSLLADVQQSVTVQRRFVADAAHQLRTPVAGLRVLTQELEFELGQYKGAQTAAWQPLLSALLRSSDRLARLIGQLLSLVRSQGAHQSTAGEPERQDVRPLLREAAEPFALRAARQGRSLLLEMPDAPVLARADSLWLGEALANVLDNALRYGGTQIVVTVQSLPDLVQIDIEDDGVGVAAADLPRLTEAFWRGERADTRGDDGSGGSGLGLAIAYEVIARLGGHWSAQTRPEFAGLRIRWRLPA
ncbi:sensor histidine kinase [Roseateles oligotrophus]|uniref:histidine kinase n=1 Tax=Roseateles oligotrophus TaxID=1769250 RepID=A0ABT2YH53_9BURK|nr:sensor histidine kinase [Roseateles oligotrophus]MCV2369310.1 sensor histidine kinase N-terminal domain-containing protein [Roseateles oligotrophus]